MITRAVLVTAIAALLTFGAGIAQRGVGAEERTPQNPAPQGTTPQPQPGMADMMKMHEQMMAEMKAGDAKFDALVKDMNAAAGDAKVNAMAAVVNELVRQHKAMHERMGQMHQQMMGPGMMMRR
jgi:hypothetical protein